MNTADIIAKKRDGGELTSAEIAHVIDGLMSGRIADYQMAALLMAIYLKGMTTAETLELTRRMLYSGTVLDPPGGARVAVDKHSTGGVGDKTSLVIAPVVAAAGAYVPMISGRALGHSGGTLDKLESIPGFTTSLSLSEFHDALDKVGVALIGQTEEIAP
ncbi:MAG TPA: thymidine phosphorylase, partial [Blastocatellia bacterium]|nr:thymidine phosphorylase [Blastocatellia bacterium]